MRTILLGALMLALVLGGAAGAADKQQCTDASAGTAPSTWKSSFQPGVETGEGIPRADLPGVMTRTVEYSGLLRKALGDPPGYALEWHRSIGGQLFGGGPAQYITVVMLYAYECDRGILKREIESTATAAIDVNSIWVMSGIARYTIGGKPYYSFASRIGEVRGFPAYQTDYHSAGKLVEWVVLVAKPGKRPFGFATRKEHLDSMLELNEANRAKAIAISDSLSPIRPKAAQEQDKQKELALFLKGAKDEQQRQNWIARFEHDYQTDDQKREAARRKLNAFHDKVRVRLNTVMARYSPEELKQTGMSHPRSVMLPWDDFDFKPTHQEVCGKGVCGDGHGRSFALPIRTYFDADVSIAVPQFFTVSFEWAAGSSLGNPLMEKMRDEFFARFDFDKLVALLGQ
jgi:hypothetical protein